MVQIETVSSDITPDKRPRKLTNVSIGVSDAISIMSQTGLRFAKSARSILFYLNMKSNILFIIILLQSGILQSTFY